jgi:predicted nucleotidyltransferase
VLTKNKIIECVKNIAEDYEIVSVAYFGSYANGCVKEDSDLDLLVEFSDEFHSLFIEMEFQQRLEAALGVSVDVATLPRPEGSTLIIENKVIVYETNRHDCTRKNKRRSVFSDGVRRSA